MNVLLEAYLERNFGDDLFVTLLINRYRNHRFYLLDDRKKGYALVGDSRFGNVCLITEEEAFSDMQKFGAYLLVGGDFYHANGDYHARVRRAKAIHENGGYVLILGASLYKTYPADRLPFVQEFFRFVDVMTLRERTSYAQCEALMPDSCALLSSDMAFTLASEYGKKQERKGIRKLGISVRRKMDGTEEQFKVYCKTITDVTMAHLNANEDNRVCFLALSTSGFDDRDVIDQIRGLLPHGMNNRIDEIEYSRDVYSFMDEVSTCDALICTRFHSLCLALIQEKPFYPINYEAKVENLLKDIGFGGTSVDYGVYMAPEAVLQALQENRVDEEKYREYVERARHFFDMSDFVLDGECKMNEEYGEVLQKLTRRIYEKETEKEEREKEIDRLNKMLAEAQDQLRLMDQENTELREKYNRALETNAMALSQAQYLVTTRKFKMLHLMTRIRRQLINRDREERKLFCNWLKGRLKRIPDYDRRYNPLYTVINTLKQTNADEEMPSESSTVLNELETILDTYQGKRVIVLPELVDWNIPLFQRPQQLAMSFAELGVLFIYFTPNQNDNVHSVKKLMDKCILLPPQWFDQVVTLLKQRNLDVVLDICSTDNKHFMPWIDRYRDMGCRVLYEYIDEISDDITGKVPRGTFERHRELLKDVNVSVVATADKLYNEVLEIRGCEVNCLNSGNGVDLRHFRIETDDSKIPMAVRQIIRTGKPIIGYFGAIANWFDFGLIEYAARQRKDYEFMMIGPNYGSHDLNCLTELKEIKNLHFVGTIEYQKLPHVAAHFTVATIPFKLNEITESTSPIKLFEYMAMGKPVVTTAMRECFKYPVVRIAKDKEDYVAALDEAVFRSKDEQFLTEIAEVAEHNSWMKKAQEISELLGLNE